MWDKFSTPLTSATVRWVSGEMCATVDSNACVFGLNSACEPAHGKYVCRSIAMHSNHSRTQWHKTYTWYLIQQWWPIPLGNTIRADLALWVFVRHSRTFYGATYDAWCLSWHCRQQRPNYLPWKFVTFCCTWRVFMSPHTSRSWALSCAVMNSHGDSVARFGKTCYWSWV